MVVEPRLGNRIPVRGAIGVNKIGVGPLAVVATIDLYRAYVELCIRIRSNRIKEMTFQVNNILLYQKQ